MSSSNTDLGPAASARPSDDAHATLVEVTMPQMGVSVAEGTIVAWRKQVGDWVNVDETLCEISTDKIDTEVPSPAAGRIVELIAEVEQTVQVGAVLARIATDALAGDPHPAEDLEAPQSPAAERAGDDRTAAAAEEREADQSPSGERGGDDRTAAPAADAERVANSGHYSPVVRRIASAEHVDLSRVPGSGRGGRVQKRDVMAFIERRRELDGTGAPAGESARQGAAARPAPDDEAPLHIESPYRGEEVAGPATSTPASAAAPTGGERLSRMRRSIAEHMVASLHTAAHCTSIVEADFTRLEAARQALGLTYLPFVARCVVEALRAHPALNATLEGDVMTRHSAVNLGIAVSLGEDGLIVPVVHDAHELSHEGLARRIAELARRARARELTADEVRGGTFTITNPGGYGTIASTPIINQPQVAILDLEAVVRRPVVVADADGREAIAIRSIANLCLSWDHRALDGALAAQFLGTLRARIESWEVR